MHRQTDAVENTIAVQANETMLTLKDFGLFLAMHADRDERDAVRRIFSTLLDFRP